MIAPRNAITADDRTAIHNFLELGAPLSGYLAGNPHGGAAVQRLEDLWRQKFGRRHAIAVNSATSGLLAACVALGCHRLFAGTVGVPALSMSATAAVPLYCGADLHFLDVDAFGCAKPPDGAALPYNMAMVTSLFGCPIDREWGNCSVPVVLDNAQGILSGYDDGRWSDCMGTIAVTSFNVHKQINAGEGGIVATDDDDLAQAMHDFINHGENRVSPGCGAPGLNLRMTELSAMLALSQLARIDDTIGALDNLCRSLDGIMPSAFKPLGVRPGCQSGHYCYAFRAGDDASERNMRLNVLKSHAVPAIPMYRPLYALPAFAGHAYRCPNAEAMADQYIVLEICSWRFEDGLAAVGRALEKAAQV